MLESVFRTIVRNSNYTVVNLGRVLMSLVFFLTVLSLDVRVYFYLTLFHLGFALVWLILNLFPNAFTRSEGSGYIPLFLDCLIITIFCILTGHVNSFVSIGYVVIVVITSINLRSKAYGRVSVLLSVGLFFLAGVLIMYNKIPVANLFGYVGAIRWEGLLVASFLLWFSLSITNLVITNAMDMKKEGEI